MLRVHRFTFNPFQENTYLLINERSECWIVDPGMYGARESKLLIDYLDQNALQPKGILNTHAHIDHILGIPDITGRYGIPFLVHELEQPVLDNATASAYRFGLEFPNPPVADSYLKETSAYQLGEDEIEILLAPGHSPGSIVFYYKPGNWLIGGDVLFLQSIGRTDLPGGNHQQLLDSIRTQIFTLPDETVVYPGHGPETTIGYEKQHNPFL